jgi:hypothetical protein
MSSLSPKAGEGTVAVRPPIFIVGSPRSGTSLLRLILDSHPAIACGPESHILSGMGTDLEKFWRQLQRYGWDESYWHAKYRELFESFKSDYARSKGKVRWADKTPRYARHLPFIASLFPEAQVVHVIRDVRLVTASALARWGWRRAWEVPEHWVTNVTAARAFGASAPAGRYREIRFEDLVGDTETTLRGLFEWLGEDWDPRVLDYDRFDHDDSTRNQTISAAARATGGAAIDARRARAARRTVDPLLRTRMTLVAGRLNRELGYR